MNHTIARFLLAAGLALPLLAPAATVTAGDTAPQAQEMKRGHGHPHGQHHGKHRHGHHGRDGKPFFLRGITLTAEQDARVQALLKEPQPALQTKREAAHKARVELQQLVVEGRFDEKQAQRLAQAAANARAEADVMKARRHAQVLQILTPEQRQQVEKSMQERAAKREAKRAAAAAG